MKLFVWKEVFCDHTCGMAVALAESKDEAIRFIKEHNLAMAFEIAELQRTEPTIYTLDKPMYESVWGGA